MRRLLILLFLVVLPLSACAQDNVFGGQGDVAFFERDGKTGLMDREGNILLQPIYDNGGVFGPGGLARVVLGDQMGAVDRTGKWVVPLTEAREFVFHWDGMVLEPDYDLFILTHKDGSQSCYTSEGKLLGDRSWKMLFSFVNGSAVVESEQGWNLLSRTGELLLDEWYEDFTWVYGGGGIFWRFNTQITVDAAGRIHSTAVLSSSGEPMTLRWLDPVSDKEYLLPGEWENAELFSSDLLIYQQNGLWGLAGRNGEPITPPMWDHISCQNIHFPAAVPVIVEKDGLYGMIDVDGTVLQKPQWACLERMDSGVCVAWANVEGAQMPYCTLDAYGRMIERLPEMTYTRSFCADGFNAYDCRLPDGRDGWFLLDQQGHVIYFCADEEEELCGMVAIGNNDGVFRVMNNQRPAYFKPGHPLITSEDWADFSGFVDDAYINIIRKDGSYLYIGLMGQPDVLFSADGGIPGSSVWINGEYYIHMATVNQQTGQIKRSWANQYGQLVCGYQ